METQAITVYENKGHELLVKAAEIMIVDDTTREIATEFTANCRKMIKNIEAEFKPDIEQAHQLHVSLLERMKNLTAPFKDAQKIVDAEISREYMEREKVRREQECIEREKADRERREQEALLAKEAEKAIADGDMERAEQLAATKVHVAPVAPVAPTTTTTRTSVGSATMRKDIDVVCTDKLAVITAVMDGKLPDLLLTVDVGAAKRYAKASNLTSMPGFSITEKAVVSGRVF